MWRRHSKGTRKQMQDIRAQGASASSTRSRRHAVSANTSRLANTQTKARYTHAGAENAQTGRTCSASTRPGEMRPTRMVEDGRKGCSLGIKVRLVAEDLGLFSNLPGAQPVSGPLAAERVGSCHLQSTTPLRNGRGRPARTHPNEQPRVLRQGPVARRYGSAHASVSRASALGHFWRLPFLLRILCIV